jgi:tRNA A37 threonylcarbamoyladenosine synthetase subunit TsaC/SUA5/YrdC
LVNPSKTGPLTLSVVNDLSKSTAMSATIQESVAAVQIPTRLTLRRVVNQIDKPLTRRTSMLSGSIPIAVGICQLRQSESAHSPDVDDIIFLGNQWFLSVE